MSWKGTIVLAVLAAGSFIAWILVTPSTEIEAARPRPFEWRESTYQTITIRVPDQPEILLRRNPQPVEGSLWRIEKLDKPADDTRVAEMIAALRRLSRDNAIKPGDPEHTPSVYGLDKPVVTVVIAAAGDTRTLKFGDASKVRADYRFFMIDGEPEIFLGPVDTAPPFQRTAADLRSRAFLSYDPGGVTGVDVARKYLTPVIGPDSKPVKGPDDKPVQKAAYEKLKFLFREQPGAGKKGWYLVSVNGESWDERAQDGRLAQIISGLKDLKAEEFLPMASPGDFGFDNPELIVTMDVLQPPSTDTKPILVELGRTDDKGTHKVTYVRVDGAKEVAAVSAAPVERLPRERKQFVSPDLIDFDPMFLETVEMVTDTGHRVKLVKVDREERQGQNIVKGVAWTVAEPAGLPVEATAVNDFVTWLIRVTTSDILGAQPDLAPFGLDKPAITLTLRIKPKTGEPLDKVYRIGSPGDSKFAYLLKPGNKEVYQLSEEIWRRFDRTDLNFRQLTMFNTTSDAIVGMSFWYAADHLSANPVRYAVRRGEGKTWEFEDPALRKDGHKVDPDRMDQLLGQLNFVRAEAFLTRNPRVAREYKLDDSEPKALMGRLTIKYADPANPGKSAEMVFRFSKSFLDPSGRVRLYYAKIEPAPGDTSPSSDATIVFRIKTEFVELLRSGVLYEAKVDRGFTPGQKDEPAHPHPHPPPPPKPPDK